MKSCESVPGFLGQESVSEGNDFGGDLYSRENLSFPNWEGKLGREGSCRTYFHLNQQYR